VLLPGIPVVGPLTGGSSAFTSAGTAVAMQTLKNSRAHTDATDGSRQPHQYAWEAPMYEAQPCRRAAANLPVFLSGENFVQPVPLHDQSKLSAPRVTCGHLAAKSARATERWFSDQSLA